MGGFLKRPWMSALIAAFLAVSMVLTANKLVKRIRKLRDSHKRRSGQPSAEMLERWNNH